MQKPHNQQGNPSLCIQCREVKAAGQQDIGNQHNDGGDKLKQGSANPIHISDGFVEQNNAGVEYGGAQSQ